MYIGDDDFLLETMYRRPSRCGTCPGKLGLTRMSLEVRARKHLDLLISRYYSIFLGFPSFPSLLAFGSTLLVGIDTPQLSFF
jgi:hypothetical protein